MIPLHPISSYFLLPYLPLTPKSKTQLQDYKLLGGLSKCFSTRRISKTWHNYPKIPPSHNLITSVPYIQPYFHHRAEQLFSFFPSSLAPLSFVFGLDKVVTQSQDLELKILLPPLPK
jgi:hypothetical protein